MGNGQHSLKESRINVKEVLKSKWHSSENRDLGIDVARVYTSHITTDHVPLSTNFSLHWFFHP